MAATPYEEDEDSKYGNAMRKSAVGKTAQYIGRSTPQQVGEDARDLVSRGIESGIGLVNAGNALSEQLSPIQQAGSAIVDGIGGFASGYFGVNGKKPAVQQAASPVQQPATPPQPVQPPATQPASPVADTKNASQVNQSGSNAENVAVNSPQNATTDQGAGVVRGGTYTNPETEGMNAAQTKAYWQNQSAMYDEKQRQRDLQAQANASPAGPSEYEKETAIRNAQLTAHSINAGVGRQKYRGNEADMTAKLAALELSGASQGDTRAAAQQLQQSQNRQAQLEQQLGAFLPKVQTADEKAFGALALQKAGQEASKGQLELNQAAQVNTLREQLKAAKTPEEKAAAQSALKAYGIGNDENNFEPAYDTDELGNKVFVGGFDKRTGQVVPKGAGQSQSGSPYTEGQRLQGKDGKTYVVKNGVPVLE